ncbi:MAG: hypothetical protein JWN54_512 [Mycobacterium sp.]|nr:hypothetical protein [Mycobacterium sp.]
MHVRFTLLPGDPAQLGNAIRFYEEEVRPQLEGEAGSLGLSLFENAELGVAAVETWWVSGDAMRETEKTEAPMRTKAARMAVATTSVERFQVGSYLRAARPHPGAGLRLTRLDTDPARLDAAVTAYQDTAVPWLTDTDGFCETMLYVDRRTGRAISETVWRDSNALAASRSASAAIRVETVEATDTVVRAVEEYRLVSTSLRRG